MRKLSISGLVAAALIGGLASAAHSVPHTYQAPPDTVSLVPGPNMSVAEQNCSVCHSVDYLKMQPPHQGKTFWTTEVNKMIKVYGATIEPQDAAKIIEYLAAAY